MISGLYPPRCVLCDNPGYLDLDICDGCLSDLRRIKRACRHCAIPLESDVEGLICGRCLRKPPPFDAALSPFHYAHPMDWLVQQLKFHRKLSHGRLLGNLMTEFLASRVSNVPDCLIAVPLHSKRLGERGYNQALELAKPIAAELGIPIDIQLCRRIRHTTAQLGLDAKQRRANLRHAFDLSGKPSYRHIALIDDVVTTGTTVSSLATLLKSKGVERVEVWSLCRAALNHE